MTEGAKSNCIILGCEDSLFLLHREAFTILCIYHLSYEYQRCFPRGHIHACDLGLICGHSLWRVQNGERSMHSLIKQVIVSYVHHAWCYVFYSVGVRFVLVVDHLPGPRTRTQNTNPIPNPKSEPEPEPAVFFFFCRSTPRGRCPTTRFLTSPTPGKLDWFSMLWWPDSRSCPGWTRYFAPCTTSITFSLSTWTLRFVLMSYRVP